MLIKYIQTVVMFYLKYSFGSYWPTERASTFVEEDIFCTFFYFEAEI